MEEKRTIRVMHQGNPSRQLAHHEAVLYMATRELPERVILTNAPPDYAELYENSNEQQRYDMRLSGGHLTVAYGHVVYHAGAVDDRITPSHSTWEPITGLEVTMTPFDVQVNIDTGGGDIALSIGGRPHSVDEAQALLRVYAVAVGIAASAQVTVYRHNIVTS